MQAMPSCYTDKKSEAQLKQRSGMKNILAMYRKVKEAVSGCFEERHGKQRDYNCFVSHNLLQSPVPMSKQEFKNGETILAPYVISSGSLPSLDYEWKNGRLSFLMKGDEWKEGDILRFVAVNLKGTQVLPAKVTDEVISSPCNKIIETEELEPGAYGWIHIRKSRNKNYISRQTLFLVDSSHSLNIKDGGMSEETPL